MGGDSMTHGQSSPLKSQPPVSLSAAKPAESQGATFDAAGAYSHANTPRHIPPLSSTGAMAAPNIVVILTDDQEDTSSMTYLPKLQALAAQGVTFKDSFVNFSPGRRVALSF